MAYFPNGTSGMYLDAQCLECLICEDDLTFCPVHYIQCLWNYDQHKPGNEEVKKLMNFLIDEQGNCQIKKSIDERNNKNISGPIPCMEGMKEWAKKHKIETI